MTDQFLSPNASFNRLHEEYNKYGSLVIAYDYDNTVFDFHNRGDKYSRVIKLLQDLKKIGCYLICFTAKTDLHEVAAYLNGCRIHFDTINENPPFFKSDARKIYYNAMLDDRAGLLQVYSELDLLVTLIKSRK